MQSRPIRILFDAHPLLGAKTGVGYYTGQFIAELAKQYPQDIELVGYYHNFLFRKPKLTAPAAANIRYRAIPFFPGQIVNLLRRWHIEVPLELLTFSKADFIFYPNYLGPSSLRKTPNAPVIHDLTFIDHPETMSAKNLHDLQNFVPAMLRRASFVVTVSETTKQRLCEQFALDPAQIITTPIPPPSPVNLTSQQADSLLAEQGITKPFIAFLGTIEPRKNLDKLLEAYTLLPEEMRTSHSLVIAGKLDWKYAETKQHIEQLQADGHDVIYLGYIDEAVRAALYQQASLFVLPPFYEGFGMQIPEAFSYDTACAVSDIAVFREVAGEAAAYFDPHDSHDIARVIQRELTSPSITAAARRQQLNKFSWDIICRNFYKKLRTVL